MTWRIFGGQSTEQWVVKISHAGVVQALPARRWIMAKPDHAPNSKSSSGPTGVLQHTRPELDDPASARNWGSGSTGQGAQQPMGRAVGLKLHGDVGRKTAKRQPRNDFDIPGITVAPFSAGCATVAAGTAEEDLRSRSSTPSASYRRRVAMWTRLAIGVIFHGRRRVPCAEEPACGCVRDLARTPSFGRQGADRYAASPRHCEGPGDRAPAGAGRTVAESPR